MTCFAARHYLSSLPRYLRRWDSVLKVWLVATSQIGRLASDLRSAGFEVLIDADLEQAPDTWADAMYAALGPALADVAYRALLKVLHPDVTGGDHAPMAALNVARDRAAARV